MCVIVVHESSSAYKQCTSNSFDLVCRLNQNLFAHWRTLNYQNNIFNSAFLKYVLIPKAIDVSLVISGNATSLFH